MSHLRRVLRRSMFVLAASCTVGAVLGARGQFRSTTSLLTLDVAVLDRDGNPVTGLKPDDFIVTLNDSTQPVRAMVFLATGPATAADLPAAGATPAADLSSKSEPDPKLVVILVDDASIDPHDGKGLFVAAERFVDAIPSRDWVGLATTSGRFNVNPSRDREPLQARLRGAFGWMNDPRRERDPFVGFMDALEVDTGSQAAFREVLERSCGLSQNLIGSRNLAEILARYPCATDVQRVARYTAEFARVTARTQLDTYRAVISAMAAAPGVKQLVILTGGIAVRPSESNDFVELAEAAAAAGVQVSILMEEPDDTDLSTPEARGIAQDQRKRMQPTQALAEMSGGQFFRVIGQADRFFRRVLTSASAIYRIGVELPPALGPDGNYEVKVRVSRPGAKVLASRYAVPPPATAMTPDERMAHAISTGESSYGVPVQMTAEVVSEPGASPAAIRVRVDVPVDRPGPVTGIFGMVGADNLLKTLRRSLEPSADGRTYRLDLLVRAAPGTCRLRLAVADGAGAVGTAAQTIIVR